jgi:hypothetical protein
MSRTEVQKHESGVREWFGARADVGQPVKGKSNEWSSEGWKSV